MIGFLFAITYLATSLFFLGCDLFISNKRVSFKANKITHTITQSQLLMQYIHFAPSVLCNVCILAPLCLNLLANFAITIKHDEFSHVGLVFSIIWFLIAFETVFFTSHRLLHLPILLKYIHYKHHQMKDCIGFGALYCHWIEFLFGNLFAAISGPLLLGEVHYFYLCTWTFLVAIHTVISHSGYLVTNKKGAHLIHHQKMSKNYGTFDFFDNLFNSRENLI